MGAMIPPLGVAVEAEEEELGEVGFGQATCCFLVCVWQLTGSVRQLKSSLVAIPD